MMTRNGIIYELKESCYVHEEGTSKFYFSSINHLEKFRENLTLNRETLNYSLYKRFKLWLNHNLLYDVVLYSKIEGRGFLITIKGVEYKCLKEIIFD